LFQEKLLVVLVQTEIICRKIFSEYQTYFEKIQAQIRVNIKMKFEGEKRQFFAHASRCIKRLFMDLNIEKQQIWMNEDIVDFRGFRSIYDIIEVLKDLFEDKVRLGKLLVP